MENPRKFQVIVREYIKKDENGKKYGKGTSKVLDYEDTLKILNIMMESKSFKEKYKVKETDKIKGQA